MKQTMTSRILSSNIWQQSLQHKLSSSQNEAYAYKSFFPSSTESILLNTTQQEIIESTQQKWYF